jgi:hypothetical protein
MHTTIIGVYTHTHELIKTNSNLLQKLTDLISDPKNQNSNKYLCTGLEIEGIYLGIDFIQNHIMNFSRILTNTMVIENISRNQADLSRVLLAVFIGDEQVATITEDVSENGKYKIFDKGISFGPYADYLEKWLGLDSIRSVFIVHNEEFNHNERDRLKNPSPIIIRMPIIDLDHFQYKDSALYEKLDVGYRDNLFILKL